MAELLRAGGNVDERNIHQLTPLLVAIKRDQDQVVKLLLTFGADLSLRDPNDQTPLHIAANLGRLNMVRMMCERGTDLNALGPLGSPACHAAIANRREVVEYLLAQGADPTILCEEGLTAQQWLELGGYKGRFDAIMREANARGRDPRPALHEQLVRGFMAEFPEPEAYAAKHGRTVLPWSFGNDAYDDPAVTAWARRVAEVMFDPVLRAAAEDRYLVGEELEDALRHRRIQTKRPERLS